MKTLDRYILRQYLINFLILLFVLMTLFMLVDLILNVDEFVEGGRKLATRAPDPSAVQVDGLVQGGQKPAPGFFKVVWATAYAVVDYYGPIVLLAYIYFSGLVAVGAMGFTLSGLNRSGELVAMVVGGMSMFRVAAPVLLGGAALIFLALPDQEFLIPPLATKLSRSASQVGNETYRPFDIWYAKDQSGSLLSAAKFEVQQERLTNVTILVRDAQFVPQKRITAKGATWDRERQGWVLENGLVSEPGLGGGVSLGTGRNEKRVEFYATNLDPTVLLAKRATMYPRLLGMGELYRLMGNPAIDRQQIQQILHSRFSLLAMNVLLLVMGLPFFLVREPGNSLLQGVKAAVVCLGAWAVGLMLLQTNTQWLPAATQAWLPVALYLPLSALLLQQVKT